VLEKSVVVAGDLTYPGLVSSPSRADHWEPFADRTSSIQEITLATDTDSMCGGTADGLHRGTFGQGRVDRPVSWPDRI
jgi:hypothetical protein